jgi:hypothetical protein
MRNKLFGVFAFLLIFLNIFFFQFVSFSHAAVTDIERADTVTFFRKWYPNLIQTSSLMVRGVNTGVAFVSDLVKESDEEGHLRIENVNDDYQTLFLVCDENIELYVLDFTESIICNSSTLEQKFEIFNFYYYFNKSPGLYLLDYKDGPTNIIIVPRNYIVEAKYQQPANDYLNYKTKLDSAGTSIAGVTDEELGELRDSSKEFRNNLNYLIIAFIMVVALVLFDRKRNLSKSIHNTLINFYNKNLSLNLYVMYIMTVSFSIICSMLYIKFEGNLDFNIFLLVFKDNPSLTDLRLLPSCFFIFVFTPIIFTNLVFLGLGIILNLIEKYETLEDGSIEKAPLKKIVWIINALALPAVLYMHETNGMIILTMVVVTNLFINFYATRKYGRELFPLPYLAIYVAILSLIIVFL